MNQTVDLKVWSNVKEYFAKELPQYQVQDVIRKSKFPADSHLYMVIAKHKCYPEIKKQCGGGEWVVWTCWNESTQCLNHGHYDIKDYDAAVKVADKYYVR